MQTGEPRLRDALNHVWRGLPAKMRELFCCFSCLVVFFSGVMPIISIALASEGIGTAPKLLPSGYYILIIAVSMFIAACRLKQLSKKYFSEKKAAHGFQDKACRVPPSWLERPVVEIVAGDRQPVRIVVGNIGRKAKALLDV